MATLLTLLALAPAVVAGAFATTFRATPAPTQALFSLPLPTLPGRGAALPFPQTDEPQKLLGAVVPNIVPPTSSLLAAALAWGLSRCTDADDVMLAIVSPHAYWLLREWRRKKFGDQQATRRTLSAVRQELVRLGATEPSLRGAQVSVRTKGLFSTFHKAVVRGQHVHDVLAVRVVLRRGLDSDATFEAHDAIRKLWASAAGRHKDYVARPKANGYRALHDTMTLPSGHNFELQLRTADMHTEAEWGSAAHRQYKGALLRLPMAVMSGVASAHNPEAVLSLASRLSN